MNDPYQNQIIKHAKLSPENMRAAILVGLSFDGLRSCLIKSFANSLTDFMKSEWEVDLVSWGVINNFKKWVDDPLAKEAGILCRKSSWDEGIYVRVASESSNGRNNYIGIYARDNISPARKLELHQKLTDCLGQGRNSLPFPWWQYFDEHFNFDNEEALMALYQKDKPLQLNEKDKSLQLNEFQQKLFQRIKIIGKEVDSFFIKG